jgi:hypothetical protein
VNHHLVILKKPYLDAILAGRKRIESRFARTKRYAFGRVAAGDKLFLKVSSGPVCATATVAAVKKFDGLTPQKLAELKRRYNQDVLGDDAYWRSKAGCKFGLLVWLEDVRPMDPVRICKRDWRAWVVLMEKQDFGLIRLGAV